MSQQFTQQKGAASSTPSRFKRWLMSKMAPRMFSPARLAKTRKAVEAERVKAGLGHVVEYFHQVEDAYSYLAVQALPAICERYDIELVCHLVGGPTGRNLPEPDLLLDYARLDCEQVAPHYSLAFPTTSHAPTDADILQAHQLLSATTSSAEFLALAADIGACLFAGEDLQPLLAEHPVADAQAAQARVDEGTQRQLEMKHFSGAMLYYGGEWYWGVDRLYHLERRLVDLGASHAKEAGLLYPRPPVEASGVDTKGRLTLEIYPSLRSPYTAISFDPAVTLARETGMKMVLKPVMPMVMRGVSLTAEKGRYIISDTFREAPALGADGFGGMYDPIGEPVKRGFSLYPWAVAQGRGAEFISAFLRAAFFDSVNTLNDSGMRTVVENAGLSWAEARQQIGQPGWEDQLEANRLDMYDWGSWGVPSFRLLDEGGEVLCQFWGQDRLWVIARLIRQYVEQHPAVR